MSAEGGREMSKTRRKSEQRETGAAAGVIAGIDVGGTFTDVMVYDSGKDGRGRIIAAKTATTPDNQAEGVLNAIEAAGFAPHALGLIVHGTTTTTNAVLERNIARCGLITTKGFRDVLELGRRTRPNPYGMTGVFEPLIAREFRREVPERMDIRGAIITPLDEAALKREIKALIAMGAESLLIHFLHAYANPAHELRAREIAQQLWPNDHITLGSQVLSEFREYERGTTASINAAVRPVLARYIGDLAGRLEAEGYARDLLVMTGNGGTVAAGQVADQAVKTVMSGPASGVMAAARIARDAGLENVISYDMGGTSSDVALIAGGVPEVSSELQIDYGLPVHVPMVDVRTVGAGGGSIGFVNAAGLIQVGPKSAGADPGPIAYGRGGTEPTITDANLLLGRLDIARLPGGAGKTPEIEAIRRIFDEKLGSPLGISADEAALAMIRIANTQMAGAVRMVSISQGHDPRDFALLAFGGAGPLHATALAQELAIPQVLVPARPGLVNALGCLIADLRQDIVNTVNQPLDDVDFAELHALLDRQEAQAVAQNAAQAGEITGVHVSRWAEMQFKGQTHLITVPVASARVARAELQAAFEQAYLDRFQVELDEIKAVLVNIHTVAIAKRPPIALDGLGRDGAGEAKRGDAATATREVIFDDGPRQTMIYDRLRLPAEARIEGPAILEQPDATVLIEPGMAAQSDAMGNLIVTVPAAAHDHRVKAVEAAE